jgi:regulator of RNase E activity RraA
VSVGERIVSGDVVVEDGDLVAGDHDGVVVVSADGSTVAAWLHRSGKRILDTY